MRVFLATVAANGEAANEDFAAAGLSGAVLLDGAGIPPCVESGCSHGVAWFSRTLGGCLLAAISDGSRSLASGLADSIGQVRSLHSRTCDVTHPGSPSATVVAIRALAGMLEYLVLADSVLLAETDGAGPLVLCDDRERTTGLAYRAALDAATNGTEAHTAAFREYIKVMQGRRNKPGGFWVAAADPAAAAQALTGQLPLTVVRSVTLLSDGASRLADKFGLCTWPEVVKIITGDGPEHLVALTRAAEASDPDGTRWPRAKARDDATVLHCTGLAGHC